MQRKNKNKKKPKANNRTKRAVMTASMNAAVKWDALLRDPCSAELAQPCYTGTDGGYLVRTVDVLTITATGVGLVAGTTYPCSAYLSYQPSVFTGGATNAAYMANAFAPGGADPFTAVNSAAGTAIGFVSNFINNAPVARFRPVAACLKWIPTGPYSTRQGAVGLGYATSLPIAVAATSTYGAAYALSQSYASNGARPHEVRWLPTVDDQEFVGGSALNSNLSGGTIFIALRGVDGTGVTATTATLNGYVEITTVWEWQPQTTQGLTIGLRAPTSTTMQDVLSSISDMGAYLFDGIRHEASGALYKAGRGAVRAASTAAYGLLTTGVRQVGTRGAALLLT